VVMTFWLANYLGAEEFGALNYAIAYATLFGFAGTLGFEQTVVRRLVENPDERDDIVGATLGSRLLGGLLMFLTLATVVYFADDDATTRLVVIVAGVATVFQSFETIDLYFQALVQSRYSVVAKNVAYASAFALRVGLIVAEAPTLAFAAAFAAEFGFMAIGWATAYQKRTGALLRLRFSRRWATRLFAESWPLLIANVAIVVYMNIDQIMLKHLADERAVGVYSAAVRFAQLWYFIPTALVNSAFPSVIQARKEDPALYRRRLSRLYSTLSWTAIAVAIPFTFLSDPLFATFFDDSYAGAGAALATHIWAGVFVFQGVARGAWLVAEGLQRYASIFTFAASAVNVGLNFYLIPEHGAVGAAIATVVSYGASVLVFPYLIPKTRPSSVQLVKSLFFK
ncbi:MAG: oligosaccharide flippase family protein, partial [Ignavibacteriales bacterium]|nr:oligosaccharide flippase family protein [Ignavibacteriales bacterium]